MTTNAAAPLFWTILSENECKSVFGSHLARNRGISCLTTGSEAESISAHFLHHLVAHPKRGKYGLYHSPTLSFLSLYGWLGALSTRSRRPGRVSTLACCRGAWVGSPHPMPPSDSPFDEQQGTERLGQRVGEGLPLKIPGAFPVLEAPLSGASPHPSLFLGEEGSQNPKGEDLRTD